MAQKTSSSTGVGFLGLLTALFIGLKLTGYITWSWWWITGPLWIPFPAGMILGIIYLMAVEFYRK